MSILVSCTDSETLYPCDLCWSGSHWAKYLDPREGVYDSILRRERYHFSISESKKLAVG